MSERPLLVFIKFARFSFTNGQIERFLHRHFAEFDIETIDVAAYLKSHPVVAAIAALETVLRERSALWDGRRTVREAIMHGLVRSPDLRRKVGAYLERTIRRRYGRARLMLISQTLFGCHVEGIPLYVYTDSAALTNLYTDTFRLADLPPATWLLLEKAFLHQAAMVFSWSSHVSRSLIELYHLPADRVDCLLAGCNFEPLPDYAAPAPFSNKTILFVGVEWERKGGPLLIEAFERLPRRHADARLLVVGCAPVLHVPQCTVVGRVDLAEMGNYYSRAAIFCLPTRSEPFGIAFIEAMSHALATVAPRMGAMPDYIEHGVSGRLHRPGDADDILQQLTWLLDNPDARHAMAIRGFDSVQGYRWDKVGRRMRDCIAVNFTRNGRVLLEPPAASNSALTTGAPPAFALSTQSPAPD